MFKRNQCISWKQIISKAKTSWYTKLLPAEIEKIRVDCIIFLLEEASYQLILVCSTLHFVMLPQEKISITRTNLSFLSEFALTGVSLNSKICQIEVFSLVPWRFELPGVSCISNGNEEAKLKDQRTNWGSYQRCSIKKGILKNFAKFTGKHLCQSLFFNKVVEQNFNLFKKETLAQVFSCEFCKFFKSIFFTEYIWTTASEWSMSVPSISSNSNLEMLSSSDELYKKWRKSNRGNDESY